MLAAMRFELVRERVLALPREMPEAPAILTPVRLDSPEALFPPDPAHRGRPAAVLVLLFPDAEGNARVLLTARAPHGIGHPGEISFPGGSAEPDDVDPIATALRESAEEVGLDPVACGLRVAGCLEVFALTVSGFRITPVVALAERRPECTPAPDEVARIVEAPAEAFLPDAPVELEERVIRQRFIRYGVYPVEGERVWGATARMLGQLGALLAAEPAPVRPPPATAGTDSPEIRAAAAEDRARADSFVEAMAPDLARVVRPSSRAADRRSLRPDRRSGELGTVGSNPRSRRPARVRRPRAGRRSTGRADAPGRRPRPPRPWHRP